MNPLRKVKGLVKRRPPNAEEVDAAQQADRIRYETDTLQPGRPGPVAQNPPSGNSSRP